MSRSNLVQGTLDLMVLQALAAGPLHGYAIVKWIKSRTDDYLQVEEGALYPALYRMSRKKWLDSELGLSENNRKAKFYRLTVKGRSQLSHQTDAWIRYTSAVNKVLAATVGRA